MDRVPAAAPFSQRIWDRVPRMVRKWVVGVVLAHAAVLEGENRDLHRELEKLRVWAQQNSTNSSRPPSSDPPWVKRKPKKKVSGRYRGGQPGHPGRKRELIPEADVDELIVHEPDECAWCSCRAFAKDDDPDPVRHQVVELPQMQLRTVEHRLRARRCRRCWQWTRCELPEDVPESNFGPRLHAAISLLTGRYRISRREVVQLCADLFGLKISLGAVSKVEQRLSRAVAGPVREVHQAVKRADVVNADETGWRQANKRCWLWTATTATETIFLVERHRNADVVTKLLGDDFGGYLVSDRFSAYSTIPDEQRGICHAHLVRDFQKMVDKGGVSAKVGEAGLAQEHKMFELWNGFKAGRVSDGAFASGINKITGRMEALLERGADCGNDSTERTCRNLLSQFSTLWTFASVDGVEPTNNAAERVLRKAVLWRKGSFGSDSPSGSRYAERMLTVAATCQQRGHKLLAFLTDAMNARMTGTLPPSLLSRPDG